jgi:c-di-GMP-binding flagellar brake protein YcgR
MALLKSLLNRWLQSPADPGTTGDDRYRQLERLQRHHSFLDVHFPRIDRRFQSLILELHPDEGYLLIDELFPADGRQLLLEGDVAEISARDSGGAVNFFSRLLLRERLNESEPGSSGNATPAYRMELPEEIGGSFRRHAFRVYVERENDLLIDLRDGEGNLLPARIVNLSADGIKFSVDGDAVKLLERHRHFDDALIRLPDGIEIDCAIDLRNIYLMRTPRRHTLAGGRLEVTLATQRNKLSHYLAAVQRRQRRRESRLDG